MYLCKILLDGTHVSFVGRLYLVHRNVQYQLRLQHYSVLADLYAVSTQSINASTCEAADSVGTIS